MAGFIPVGFNACKAGAYTISLLWVIAISLTRSGIVADLFARIPGTAVLPKTLPFHAGRVGSPRLRFRRVRTLAMGAKWLTGGIPLAAFALPVFGMKFVKQPFFPTSGRPELILDVALRQHAACAATDPVMADLDTFLATRQATR